ncbi:MAG: hypothetical protein JXA08_09620 [Methanomicrobiaceae archaeon]|nr:hypothetical protein [Methanomicrobiaceae archaeon]
MPRTRFWVIYIGEAIVRHIDVDFEKLNLPKGGSITLPMRAKHLDSWAREFLDAHPESTGIRCFFHTRL